MAEKPTQETIEQMHRWFAIECNNRAWDLISKSARTAADDREMLLTAYASVFHWSKIGTPLHITRGEMLLAHVHSRLGQGETALGYAQSCLTFCENNACEDWDLAFAHAEAAFAAAVSGDATLHASHYAKAKECGEAIKEEMDRNIFFEEFAKIPEPA